MQLEVTLEEAVFIRDVIGETPSKTGASTLYQKLRQQIEGQAQQPVTPPLEPSPQS